MSTCSTQCRSWRQFLQWVRFEHEWQGTCGHLSTAVPDGSAGTATVDADAMEGGEAAAAKTSPTPRAATAFASPCSPPAGSRPTGIGPRTAPNGITTGPTAAGPTAAGSDIRFEEAAAGWSPTGFSNACAQKAGGTPPEPPDEDEPAGEALLRSFLCFAAAAACSGVKADMAAK